jgi:hypothetical protein
MPDSTPRTPAFWIGWISAAVLLVIAAIAGVYAANLRLQLEDVELRLVDAVTKLQVSEARLVGAATDSDAIRANLALLAASDAIDFKLTGRAQAPRASGRVFASRTHGVLFAASNLPPLPEDRTYQLWYLTRGGAVSAGILRPDAQGNATAAFDAATDAPASPAGFSVSIEPDAGVPAPTGAVVLSTQP